MILSKRFILITFFESDILENYSHPLPPLPHIHPIEPGLSHIYLIDVVTNDHVLLEWHVG